MAGAWIRGELAPEGMTVLLRLEDTSRPVALGYHDGSGYRCAVDGDVFTGPVVGWLHKEEAAMFLDISSCRGFAGAGSEVRL